MFFWDWLVTQSLREVHSIHLTNLHHLPAESLLLETGAR